MLFSSFYSRINPSFTIRKWIGVWNRHATRGHWKKRPFSHLYRLRRRPTRRTEGEKAKKQLTYLAKIWRRRSAWTENKPFDTFSSLLSSWDAARFLERVALSFLAHSVTSGWEPRTGPSLTSLAPMMTRRCWDPQSRRSSSAAHCQSTFDSPSAQYRKEAIIIFLSLAPNDGNHRIQVQLSSSTLSHVHKQQFPDRVTQLNLLIKLFLV